MHYVILAVLLGVSPVSLAAEQDQLGISNHSRTGKERLTDKASDEQRVNDCKVPEALRTRPRATACYSQPR